MVAIGPADRCRWHRYGRCNVFVPARTDAAVGLGATARMGDAGGQGAIVSGGASCRIVDLGSTPWRVWQRLDCGLRDARCAADRCGLGAPCGSGKRVGLWRITGKICHRRMVLGRHAPAIARLVTGVDGAAVGDGRERRRVHHGQLVPTDVHGLPRPAAGVRILRLCR